ncbi:MAG: phenylalanine--tRNA ligase subunit beta [Rickettsiaceae bacterium]|nr:phenylalanine--tRNA ligase subunit beta [Rickettsiaceae bacterium]
MRFTLSWLKKFLDTDASLEKIAHTLTHIGLEVEDIDDKASQLGSFEVAEIIEAKQHPNADKLKLCMVKTKDETLQIVCGAPNARAGIKVVLAKIGTIIPNGNFKIKRSKIRDVESCGMMCSANELGIGDDHDRIIELPSEAVIGEPFSKYFGFNDPVIHINITPNRADGLGVYGIARDLAAAGIGTLKELKIPDVIGDFKPNIALSVKDSLACPLFAIREITGLSNKQSPDWLKNLLENIGLGSISAIVDVTNYIAYSFGQPMHAYDADKLTGKLQVELLSEATTFKALNDKEYRLEAGDLIIKDEKSLQCAAGIIGGDNSACSDSTKTIILEAACFNAENIAKTGRRLAVDTDSRYRFERNVDREFTLKALDYATSLILSIVGGKASEVSYVGNSKLPSRKIEFPVSYLLQKAGFTLPGEDICNLLSRLGFACEIKKDVIHITIPSWRYDVTIKEDIVEEILRIHGYDKIPETPLPIVNIKSKTTPKEQRKLNDIRRQLAASSYTEVVTWSFMSSKDAELFSKPLKEELTLQNPITNELDYMRPTIIANLLKIAVNNINRSFKDLAFFEIGPIFHDVNDERNINSIAAIRIGNLSEKNCHDQSRLVDVFDVKEDLENILQCNGLAIDKCQIDNNVPSYYHPTKSAILKLGKKIIAVFGELHPIILQKFDLDVRVIAFEINVDNLPVSKDKFGMKPEYIASDYQSIVRDYAFVIDKSMSVGDLLSFIRNVDKQKIKKVSLFDVYTGDKIEADKKSVALSVQIQDNHKTLTESDIETINKAIISGIEQKFSGILRS